MGDSAVNKSDTLVPVFLLCGGKGDRLKPLTEARPKPLVEIRGRPILDYIIRQFRGAGFTRFVIGVGYKAEMIQVYMEKEYPDLNITLVNSGDADIVKRIADALPHLDEEFIVSYGDTLADVDFSELIRFHKSHPGRMTVTTYPLKSPFGILEIARDGLVEAFAEKPVIDKWINIGYFYIERAGFEKELRSHSSFVDFLNASILSKQLYGYKHQGMHITVNNVKELQEAEENIGEFQKHLGTVG
jgi:glucose-1-phosphate cytidylyltransferase